MEIPIKPLTSCCQNSKQAEFYCFSPECKKYICSECKASHPEKHNCLELTWLSINSQKMAALELGNIEKIIGALNKHASTISEGEVSITQVLNDEKALVTNMLMEIYRLINKAVESEIESHLFALKQQAAKKQEVEAKLLKFNSIRSEFVKKLDKLYKLKGIEDLVDWYSEILSKKINDSEETAIKKLTLDEQKSQSKYRYDSLNNKFIGLISNFTENLKKDSQEIEEKYLKHNTINSIIIKELNKDNKKEGTNPCYSNFVYVIKEKASEILIYNAQLGKNLRVFIDNWKFLKFFDSVQIGSKIYYSGGGMYLKTTYEYNFLRNCNTFERKSDMNVGKNLHKLVAFSKCQIYSLGGKAAEGPINICEVFDLKGNIWKMLPGLNESKYGISPAVIDNRFIFIFGGYSIVEGEEKYLSTIEKLDTQGKIPVWERILAKNLELIKPLFDMASIPIAKNKIILFGGYDGTFHNTCYEFNTDDNSFEKKTEMTQEDSFHGSKPVLCNNQVWIIGHRHKDIHVFDLKSAKWKLIAEESWIPQNSFKS